ncbi:MAG: lytic transglycosylase domain-containing protein [Actinobacteria bacterium]|nr:lytic transglycosylase domain-containing protein [Actinomycetota bacterium]
MAGSRAADVFTVTCTRRARRGVTALQQVRRLAVVVVLLTAGADPASAKPDRPPEPLPPATPGPPPEDDTPPPAPPAPPLAPPGADEAGRARAAAEVRAAEVALKAAKAKARAKERALQPFQRRLATSQARMALLGEEERRVAEELAQARGKVRKLAVAGYVHGGDALPVDYLLRASDPADLMRRRSLVRSAAENRQGTVREYEAAGRAVSGELREAVQALDDAKAAFAQAESEAASAAAIAAQLEAELEHRRQLLDLVAAAAPAVPSDIPRLFLDAYRSAAATLARRSPNCRLSWPAIAAIGKVESNHGRYRGALLALNGDVYPRILGIPLDGTRSALIHDTDLGHLDFDTVYDRAVGPMQFIPSTWSRINADGNGDAIHDPNNAYDAALGTAAYLCRAVPAGGLDTDEGLRPAFFSYNHSDAYVEMVLGWAHTYREMAAAGL